MADRFTKLKQLLSCGATDDVCLDCECEDNLITRGSTSLQTFKLPFKLNIVKDIKVSYFQDDLLVVNKTISDFKMFDNILYFYLSEDETFRFKDIGEAHVQLRSRLLDDEIITSDIITLKVKSPLDASLITPGDGSVIAFGADVKGQYLDINNYSDLVAGSNIYRGLFYFDSSWEGLDKEYIFKDEYNHEETVVPNGDKVFIPSKVVEKPGRVYIKIKGTKDNLVKYTEVSNALTVNV